MHNSPTVRIIVAKNRNVSRWSGGTTEELYISPKSAKYSKMNFDYRVSLATVDTSTSIFTPLPKVNRTTLILEGEIELTHTGQYTKSLKKFNQDSYSGEWETSSIGTSTNFNLMTRGKTNGKVVAHSLELDQQIICRKADHTLVYCRKGNLGVVVKNDALLIEEGSLLVLEDSNFSMIIKALEESEIIVVSIHHV